MIFEAGFLADNTYGVKHINRLVRSLVTKGIVDYPFAEDEGDIGSYNINGFIQFLSEDGVIPETHKSMLVEKTDTGYILNPGMAFLDNGIYIFIETAQEFSCEPLMKVYWMHDTLTDKVEFVCAADYPASGSYLPLAEILADGTVSNVRKCARAKLPGMVSDYNTTKKITINETFVFDQKFGANSGNGYYTMRQIDLGGNKYKYLLFVKKDSKSWAIINLETREIQNMYMGSDGFEHRVFEGKWNELQPTVNIDSFYSVTDATDFYLTYDYDNYNVEFFYMDIISIDESGLMSLRIANTRAFDPTHSRTMSFDIYAF